MGLPRLLTVTAVSWLVVACSTPAADWTPADWTTADVPEPTVFAPGVISTEQREYGIAFTSDGREAYFTRRGRRGPTRIFVSRYVDGAWTEPEVTSFATEGDEAPFITPDGSTMLFSSRRPMPGGWDRSENIWMMEREPDDWSDPVPLEGTVNQPRAEIDDYTTGAELGPILAPGGALLYWTRVEPAWGSDLYVAEADESGAFTHPRPLRLNSQGDESNPAMSPDGRHLIFQGYGNAGGFGGDDLYVAERTDYGWSEPRLLPEPINSSGADGYPSFSPDGRHFFFASDRDSRYHDIYVVDVVALGLDAETR